MRVNHTIKNGLGVGLIHELALQSALLFRSMPIIRFARDVGRKRRLRVNHTIKTGVGLIH
jgi:hypothetical protein